MTFLYLTADQIGAPSGGGRVTQEESTALFDLAVERGEGEKFLCWGREVLEARGREVQYPKITSADPWRWDDMALSKCKYVEVVSSSGYVPEILAGEGMFPRLAHVYAGTFTKTVERLKSRGCKVVYTAAAHDVAASRKAHEELGIPYGYPHLNDPDLWKRYLGGYLAADVLICPSQHSANVMREFGCKQRIEVIPHGVDLPTCKRCEGDGKAHGADRPFEWTGPGTYPGSCPICAGSGVAPAAPFPQRFVAGYLGSCGAPDKGLRYLLEAWKKLNYGSDALLLLAGRDSTSLWVRNLCERFGGVVEWAGVDNQRGGFDYVGNVTGDSPAWKGKGQVYLYGWVDNVSDFYNSISLYTQPSVTEGFGIEVLEAMAHGRPVVCSKGAGAMDLLADSSAGLLVGACDPEALAGIIDNYKQRPDCVAFSGKSGREQAEEYTWDKIRAKYQRLWREML